MKRYLATALFHLSLVVLATFLAAPVYAQSPTQLCWNTAGKPGACQAVSSTNPLPVTSGSGASAGQVQGAAAAGSAATGNTIRDGGVNRTTPPTYTDGQLGDLQIDTRGNLKTAPIGAASIATAQVSVATTATSVAAARANRQAVTITNTGTVDVFCGAAGVLTTTGTLLTGTKGASITIPTSAAVLCIVGTGTQAVTVLETF